MKWCLRKRSLRRGDVDAAIVQQVEQRGGKKPYAGVKLVEKVPALNNAIEPFEAFVNRSAERRDEKHKFKGSSRSIIGSWHSAGEDSRKLADSELVPALFFLERGGAFV